MDFSRPWDEFTYVAFDIETTGAYPLESEICEVAAVKWQGGKIIDEYQTLLKPTHLMSDFIIGIHHITNEMVANAPEFRQKSMEIFRFMEGAVGVAHHAPFDIGFLAAAFEREESALPQNPALCTSLLSRALLPEMPNHKLQTLVTQLQIEGGQAHRALSDARACLHVFLKSVQRIATKIPDVTFQQIADRQGGALNWKRFSLKEMAQHVPCAKEVLEAISQQQRLEIIYQGGSLKGQPREIQPLGIVRSLDGDFLVARDFSVTDPKPKRFYFNRLKSTQKLLG